MLFQQFLNEFQCKNTFLMIIMIDSNMFLTILIKWLVIIMILTFQLRLFPPIIWKIKEMNVGHWENGRLYYWKRNYPSTTFNELDL